MFAHGARDLQLHTAEGTGELQSEDGAILQETWGKMGQREPGRSRCHMASLLRCQISPGEAAGGRNERKGIRLPTSLLTLSQLRLDLGADVGEGSGQGGVYKGCGGRLQPPAEQGARSPGSPQRWARRKMEGVLVEIAGGPSGSVPPPHPPRAPARGGKGCRTAGLGGTCGPWFVSTWDEKDADEEANSLKWRARGRGGEEGRVSMLDESSPWLLSFPGVG